MKKYLIFKQKIDNAIWYYILLLLFMDIRCLLFEINAGDEKK